MVAVGSPPSTVSLGRTLSRVWIAALESGASGKPAVRSTSALRLTTYTPGPCSDTRSPQRTTPSRSRPAAVNNLSTVEGIPEASMERPAVAKASNRASSTRRRSYLGIGSNARESNSPALRRDSGIEGSERPALREVDPTFPCCYLVAGIGYWKRLSRLDGATDDR
jgi:hypothetical protein